MALPWTFSTLGCPDYTLEQAAELAKRFGMDRLELRALEGRIDLGALLNDRFGSPANLKKALDDLQVRVVSLDTSWKLVDGAQDAFEELVELGRWAHAIGCPYLRVFDGGTFSRQLSESDRRQCCDGVRKWRKVRSENSWPCDIIIETHDCLTSTTAIMAMEEALGSDPALILWDTHHTWKKAGEQPVATWKTIRQYVAHLHVKDSISKPTARHPYTYTHLGEGEFPLRPLLQRVESDGFRGSVSIEWEKKWHPYLDELPVALEKARAARLL